MEGCGRWCRQEVEKKPEEARKTVRIPLEAGGQATITVEVHPGGQAAEPAMQPEEIAGLFWEGLPLPPGPVIPPEDSDRVFVDITAYNSKTYYLEGDFTSPGRLPFTGHETVMDAIAFGGGLLPTADPKDIRLVRPARGGKLAKVYKVDLEAIRDKGEQNLNYQVFPGDRLIAGRNDVVKKTVQIDRLAAAIQAVTSSISQESSLLRSLQTASPAHHDAILEDLVEFWIQQMKRTDDMTLDDQTLRDALIRRLRPRPMEKRK